MRRQRGFLAPLASFSTAAYLGALLGWALLHALLGDRIWWIFLLNALALYLFVPLPFVLLLVLAGRSRLAGLGWLAAVALFLDLYGGLFVPKGHAAMDGRVGLTVMTFNVLDQNPQPERVVAALRAARADVVGLQELNPSIAKAIGRNLRALYPYQVLAPALATASGMGVVSRYALHTLPDRLPGTWLAPPQVMALAVGGKVVHLLNLHPVSTILDPPTLEREARERVQTARAIVQYVHDHPGPLIVTSDFNVGDQSTPYAIVTQALVDSWREAGWGFGHTFPGGTTRGNSRPRIGSTFVPQWLVRIDYIFHSRELQAEWARIGPWDGVSDHRPVLVRLAFMR